jgi:chromatin remodeling complex protein RSC6
MPKVKHSKKTSQQSNSVEKKSTAAAPAQSVAAPTLSVAAPVVAPVDTPTLSDQFTNLLAQLTALRSQLTSVTSQVRALQKRSDRELKAALKTKNKNKKSGNRAPSGFVKPTKISMELATFLGKPKGSEMARTEVTREINTYIRSHKLQDPSNGRRILADNKLRKLLKLKKDDELTYFNLQRYMSPHFAKAGKKVVSQ